MRGKNLLHKIYGKFGAPSYRRLSRKMLRFGVVLKKKTDKHHFFFKKIFFPGKKLLANFRFVFRDQKT